MTVIQPRSRFGGSTCPFCGHWNADPERVPPCKHLVDVTERNAIYEKERE